MNIRSPFAGYPTTKVTADKDGKAAFTVCPRYLTPRRAQMLFWATNVAAIALTYYGIVFMAAQSGASGWAWFAVFVLPWLLRPFMWQVFAAFVAKRKTIHLSEKTVIVRGLLEGVTFDRTMQHKFSALAHDKAEAERAGHEFQIRKAAQRGQIIGKRAIYGKSFHITFEYPGQRNDLMDVYGPKDAAAIVGRLQACDAWLNAQASGEGFATRAQDQWKKQPGDIPG